jgi:hypothetical protein
MFDCKYASNVFVKYKNKVLTQETIEANIDESNIVQTELQTITTNNQAQDYEEIREMKPRTEQKTVTIPIFP